MNSYEIIIKRKGIMATYYVIMLSYCLIMLAINSFTENLSSSWLISIYICGLMVLMALYTAFEFTLKFDSTGINFNKVATIPFSDIQKVYVGDFTFLESFEEKDNLPLVKYKREELDFVIGNQKMLLSIHTANQMYFVRTNYFTQNNLDKVFAVLKDKDIPCEVQSK